MNKIIKKIALGIANVVKCYTFAATVLALLPIRTACGSFYFISSPFSLPSISNTF